MEQMYPLRRVTLNRKYASAVVRKSQKLVKSVAYLLCLALCLGTAATRLMAQATAQIAGTVTDASGAVVPGATLTLKNTETNAERSSTSNTAGVFNFNDLQPGPYVITALTGGFAPYTQNVEVTVGSHITINAKLSLSNASTTVEVSTNESVMVNTQTPEVSQVISQEQVTQLPSLTRNPYDFIALSGNITSGDNTASGAVQNGANRGVNFSLNGQRNSGTEILLDGVENLQVFGDAVAVIVPVDTVQEYRVITNNFSPEYGRASGGVVAVATRAGTNAFHGRLWEFNRISATTANTVTNAQQGIPKGAYTRNQFGGIIGGPIVKDKLFFFASTELTRVRSAANITAAIPSAQLLAASAPSVSSFFSTYAGPTTGTIIGTTTNTQAGGGTPLFPSLPASLPVFTNLSFTAPSDAGGGVPQNTYNITGRVDYSASDKTQAFFRYVNYHETDQQGAIQATPYSQYDVSGTNYAQAYLLSLAHEFNSSFSTIARASFTRDTVGNGYNAKLQNVPTLNLYPNAVDPYTLNTFLHTWLLPHQSGQRRPAIRWPAEHHPVQPGPELHRRQAPGSGRSTDRLHPDEPGLRRVRTGQRADRQERHAGICELPKRSALPVYRGCKPARRHSLLQKPLHWRTRPERSLQHHTSRHQPFVCTFRPVSRLGGLRERHLQGHTVTLPQLRRPLRILRRAAQ